MAKEGFRGIRLPLLRRRRLLQGLSNVHETSFSVSFSRLRSHSSPLTHANLIKELIQRRPSCEGSNGVG